MSLSSEFEKRKAENAKKLAAFGVTATSVGGGSVRVVREGKKVTLYTVGYERRDGDDLMSVLLDQGVRALADVRERPMSRKPDFRAAALRALCESVGIEYQPWPMLGSTVDQRDQLQESGDFKAFAQRFRRHAVETMGDHLERLGASIQQKPTALLCYERLHEDCHRSVIADLVAEEINASVVALL